MKCPLLTSAGVKIERSGFPPDSYCMQEECEVWDEDKNCCSVKVIARELTNIQLKMPLEVQFRK